MKVKFVPNDVWVGIYWKSHFEKYLEVSQDNGSCVYRVYVVDFYVCPIPMICVEFTLRYYIYDDESVSPRD